MSASDIFISYAHADDEVPQGARSGWVSTLAAELKKILRRKLGGNGAEVWMDHQLAANERVSDELLSRLRESRALVLVMSPGYQKSHWCQRELANFLLDSQARGLSNNVFIVEIEPIDRGTWIGPLRDLELTPVRFWSREFEEAAPALLGYPVPPLDGSSPYWRNLNELAHWISTRLKADVPAGGKKRIVLVAETTDDLDEQRDAVNALLRQHRFDAVPVRQYPRDTEASYLRALRQDLGEAALFVQLLGPYEGKKLPGGESPLVVLQAREAVAAHRERSLSILQWRETGLDVARIKSDTHRELLAGPFVQAAGFEQFRQAVLRALKIEPEPEPAARVADEFRVYVRADAVDADLEKSVCESLKMHDVVPVGSPAAGGDRSFARGLELQAEAIRGTQGVIFVYGRTSLSWLTAQVAYAAQTMGLRRNDVWGAVLDAPPAGDFKVPFASGNLLNIDCRGGFDPAKVGHFVGQLRGKREGAGA